MTGLDISQISRFNHQHARRLARLQAVRSSGDGARRADPERGRAAGEAAMNFEEEPIRSVKRGLDDMSIQELKERIETLRSEIGACEQMIQKKEATRRAADAAFFKS
jgi:uncharacterized small protein (DUF1192 family)